MIDRGPLSRRMVLSRPLARGFLRTFSLSLAMVACRGVTLRPGPIGLSDSAPVTAILGATVIDGTGGPPLREATVVLRGQHISALGPRRSIRVPPDARTIDGRGLFVLPGFVDASVHLSRYFGSRVERVASLGADSTQNDSLITQRVSEAVRYGVTTVRDTRGTLLPLLVVRERIRTGRLSGARLLVAGPVIGSSQADDAGVGTHLPTLEAEALRDPIKQYLNWGVDFIQYSGTLTNDLFDPGSLEDSIPIPSEETILPAPVFSERAQGIIVAEAQKQGLRVETYATSPDGLAMVLMAGVDVVQHPELLWDHRVLPDELVRLFARRRVLCALHPRVSAAVRGSSYWQNAQRLIQGGCRVAVGSGGYRPGAETLRAIEGLVTLGMTPMAALVAATRAGAEAANMTAQLGTVEVGKLADLVLLQADPLQDITHIEQVAMVFTEGRLVFSRTADRSEGTHGE